MLAFWRFKKNAGHSKWDLGLNTFLIDLKFARLVTCGDVACAVVVLKFRPAVLCELRGDACGGIGHMGAGSAGRGARRRRIIRFADFSQNHTSDRAGTRRSALQSELLTRFLQKDEEKERKWRLTLWCTERQYLLCRSFYFKFKELYRYEL